MFDARIDATTTDDFDDRPVRTAAAAPATGCAPVTLSQLAAMI